MINRVKANSFLVECQFVVVTEAVKPKPK